MPECSVKECGRAAEYEVILYDYYPDDGIVFFEQDFTCAFICDVHMRLNEQWADGERVPRGDVIYRYTNLHRAQGFTIYRPLDEEYRPRKTRQRRTGTLPEVVYFLQGFGSIKIGRTTRGAETRLRDLTTGSPVPLKVLGFIPGGTEKEAELHQKFDHLRMQGEWFVECPELLAFIEQVTGKPGEVSQ